jgi:hypothetical protein
MTVGGPGRWPRWPSPGDPHRVGQRVLVAVHTGVPAQSFRPSPGRPAQVVEPRAVRREAEQGGTQRGDVPRRHDDAGPGDQVAYPGQIGDHRDAAGGHAFQDCQAEGLGLGHRGQHDDVVAVVLGRQVRIGQPAEEPDVVAAQLRRLQLVVAQVRAAADQGQLDLPPLRDRRQQALDALVRAHLPDEQDAERFQSTTRPAPLRPDVDPPRDHPHRRGVGDLQDLGVVPGGGQRHRRPGGQPAVQAVVPVAGAFHAADLQRRVVGVHDGAAGASEEARQQQERVAHGGHRPVQVDHVVPAEPPGDARPAQRQRAQTPLAQHETGDLGRGQHVDPVTTRPQPDGEPVDTPGDPGHDRRRLAGDHQDPQRTGPLTVARHRKSFHAADLRKKGRAATTPGGTHDVHIDSQRHIYVCQLT